MNIAGYQIVRELGRGGMARVYLAMQESLERYVALKVISPALTADPSFTERFLKEGRIVARLNHINIVTVYDFGNYEGNYYLAMEYLPGGTLEERIEQGLQLNRAIEIIKLVAHALGYAHKQGFIHRDVKPLNILFRKDGTPVLSDFGIARVIDSHTQLTAPGLTVGSPGYMSPERIAGQPFDGRSDLYSLGVVFYKMLSGKMPYQADDPIAVAVMHVTAPIPALPPQLLTLQPIIEKLLAKNPEQRFQTAEEFTAVLAEIEIEQSDELDAAQTTVTSQNNRQIQPSRVKTIPTPTKVSRRTKVGIGIGALSVLAAAGVYLALNTPSTDPELSQPLAKTHKPSSVPMEGMKAVADHYRKLAESRLQEGNLVESLAQIEKGLLAAPDHPGLRALRDQVQAQLAEQARRQAEEQRRQQQIRSLLASAEQQIKNARLIQPPGDNATDSYRQLLKLDPDNAQARQGLNEIASRYQQSARQFAQQNALEKSLADIDQGLSVLPDHPGLRALRDQVQAQLAEQARRQAEEQRRQQQIRSLLASAERQLQNLQLTLPAGDNAYESYRRILDLAPDNADAKEGLRQIAARYQELAEQYRREGNLQDSVKNIEQGLAVVADHPGLLALRQKVQAEIALIQQPQKVEEELRPSEVEQLLSQAELQLQKLLLTSPAGDNAYESYQRVLTLDPLNQKAREGLRQIAVSYQRLAENFNQRGDFQRSLLYIERGLSVIPEHPDLLALRAETQSQIAAIERRRAAEEERRRAETEQRSRLEAERSAKAEAERRTRAEAEQRARIEAEQRTRQIATPPREPQKAIEDEEEKRKMMPFATF